MAERIERRKNAHRDRELPTLEDMRAVFHRIWTREVGQPNYSKRDWHELRMMIFKLFGAEV